METWHGHPKEKKEKINMSKVYKRMFKSNSPLKQEAKVKDSVTNPWTAFKAGYKDKKELKNEIREFHNKEGKIVLIPTDDGEKQILKGIKPINMGKNQKTDK